MKNFVTKTIYNVSKKVQELHDNITNMQYEIDAQLRDLNNIMYSMYGTIKFGETENE